MKYIKTFDLASEYEAYMSGEPILPNVSYVVDNDVVMYNPKETRVVCTYNVTNTTNNTQLCGNPSNFTSMEVDGTLLDSVTTGYTFDTIGEHTVKFELTDSSSICGGAFSGCSSLTSINIPDSVNEIGYHAFSRCSSLTSIVIPDSVTSIDYNALMNCTSLTSINIPDSVTSIGRFAFVNCTGLTSVEIGSDVNFIGNYAFESCIGLNEITCLTPTAPTISSNTFYKVKSGGILKVPTGSDYSSWMSKDDYYLGKYNWTMQEI